MNHTPTPWGYKYDNDVGPNDEGYWEFYRIYKKDNFQDIGKVDAEDNAAFIIKAVNYHEQLKTALTGYLMGMKAGDPMLLEHADKIANKLLKEIENDQQSS